MYQVTSDKDFKILEALQSGDGEAYVTVYNRYRDWLFVVAYDKLDDEMAAQDLVQEFMINLWEKQLYKNIHSIPGTCDDTVLKNYFFRAINNRCLNYLNRQKMRSLPIAEEILPENSYLPTITIENKELEIQLLAALDKVPPRSAQAFALKHLHEKSYKEIATELGISPFTVKLQLRRALKFLRNHLKNIHPGSSTSTSNNVY